jgi:hypothetical protein
VKVSQRHSRVSVSVEPTISEALLQAQRLALLKWPQNRIQLAQLSISDMQVWLSTLDPRELVFLGQNPTFKRFLMVHYLWPVRALRFLLKIKSSVKGWMR